VLAISSYCYNLVLKLLQIYQKWHGAVDRGFGLRALYQIVCMLFQRKGKGVKKLDEPKQKWCVRAGKLSLSFGVDPAFIVTNSSALSWIIRVRIKRTSKKSEWLTLMLPSIAEINLLNSCE